MVDPSRENAIRYILGNHVPSHEVFVPLAGAALLLFFPESQAKAGKWFALPFSVVEFALSVPLWTRFAIGESGFQFSERMAWIPSLGISYSVGFDGISLVLILLTTLLTP